MTRSKPPLHQHLLTRSDLARLQVSAGDVLTWLAENQIEQVGELPDGDDEHDPVFAVHCSRLRQELALRLVEIGKPTVVLSPLRVRSLLGRALLFVPAKDGADQGPEPDLASGRELAEVLREVVAEVAADVDEVMQLASDQLRNDASDEAADSGTGNDEAASTVTAITPPTSPADAPESRDAAESDSCAPPAAGEAALTPDLVSELEQACVDIDEICAALTSPEDATAASTADAIAEAAPAAAPASESAAVTTPEAPSSEAPGRNEDVETKMTNDTMPTPGPTAVPQGEVAEAMPPSIDAAEGPAAVPPTATPVALADDVESAPATEPETTAVANAVVSDAGIAKATVTAVAAAETGVTPAPEASVPSAREVVQEVTGALLESAMQRVESFLGELQKTLLVAVQRPEPLPPPPPPPAPPPSPPPAPPVDIGPIVDALQAGFERSAQSGNAAQAALNLVGDRLSGLGAQVEQGLQALDRTMQAARPPAPVVKEERILIARSDRMPTVLLALTALVVAWSAVFWVKLDSPRLAIATLVGANLVGCCLMTASRSRT